MKRPLLGAAVAMMAGEVLAKYSDNTGFILLGLIEAGIGMMYLHYKRQKKKGSNYFKKEYMIYPIITLWGMLCYIYAVSPTRLDQYMQMINQDKCQAEVAGQVDWIQKKDNSYQIYLTDASVKIKNTPMKTRDVLLYSLEEPKIRIGTQIWADGKLKKFSSASNPGQFDVQSYYRAKKIDYQFQISEIKETNSKKDIILDSLYQIRKKLMESIDYAAQKEDAGIFQAVFLGDKLNMEEEQKDIYETGGISHILSISGLHISCIGIAIYSIFRRKTGSFFYAGIVSAVIMLLYGIMAGKAISAMRAIIMFYCMLWANHLGKVYDMTSALSLSVCILLSFTPLQLFQCGFQLSVAAVAGISILSPSIEIFYKGESRFVKLMITSVSIQLSTIPFLFYSFFTYSTYSILINFLVLPFVAYLLFSAGVGAITGIIFLPLSLFCFGTGHYIVSYYNHLCQLFDKIPQSLQIIGKPSAWQLTLYALCILAIILYAEKVREQEKQKEEKKKLTKEKNKAKGIQWWKREWEIQKNKWKEIKWNTVKKDSCFLGKMIIGMIIAIGCLYHLPYPELEITMLDVGQGDCILMHFPNGKYMLIDGGSSSVSKVGENRIEPCLKSKGIGTLDYVLMTHPDADHTNGIVELLENNIIEIKTLLLPSGETMKDEFKELLGKYQVPITWISKGMEQKEGEVTIQYMHPQGEEYEDVNDYSIVTKLSYGQFDLLLMGDLSAKEETGLDNLCDIDVLKAGHHGSKTSSCEEFLARVKPEQTILSYGKNNSYGHPSKEVVERLENLESNLWRTAEQGAIIIQTDGKTYRCSTYYIEKE